MQNTEQILEKIEQEINWHNYQNEDGTYWTTPEVLYCKIDEILADDRITFESEQIDTLQQLQKLMEALNKDWKGEF
jgi:hypothetical protein